MPNPQVPLQPRTPLCVMVLCSISGDPRKLLIPAPLLHTWLSVMMLSRIVGDELRIAIPPPPNTRQNRIRT